jgi:hypothetical protein
MQIKSQPLPRRDSGYALIMIMCFLAVSLIIFASMMYWVSSNATITQRNNAFNQAEAAAESCTENFMANMIRDYSSQSLNPASSYTNLFPSQTNWPIQYQFSNIGVSVGTTNWSALSSQFAGLWGLVQNCTNTATATATASSGYAPVSVPATVQQVLQFAAIPVFQYAIFYNMDLEICPGNTMTINGHVHSNNNIWTTGSSQSSPLTYTTNVDASGTVYFQRSTNDPQSYTTGNVFFTDTQNNPLNNADSLSMPVGTNNNPAAVAGILMLPPSNLTVPNDAGYSPTGIVYTFNGADLIITNNSYGTNWTVLYDNQYVTPHLTSVLPDVVSVSSNSSVVHGVTTWTYTTNGYYSFVTNATFWDYRESDTVQAIQIDVKKLDAWLTNNTVNPILGVSRGGYQYDSMNTSGSTSKGHNINSIYVYNSVPLTANTLPAVRLINGQQLPTAGLTVATAQPLYVQGNYNTTTNGVNFDTTLGSTTDGNTKPAALMADAVTILSSAWSDSYSLANTTDNTDGSGPNNRNATSTTINAAALEGIVPSFTDSSGGKHYSGGVENFLRLLETWSGDTLTYNGSIVVMFPSQYATNLWIGPGTYYNPPNRQWGFDVTFLKGQNYLPPLTPQAKYVIRSGWAAW